MTWDQAKDYAENLGAHPATITSQGESDFILALISDVNAKRNYYWLGGQQTEHPSPGRAGAG